MAKVITFAIPIKPILNNQTVSNREFKIPKDDPHLCASSYKGN